MITSFSSEIDRLNLICFPHDLNIINDDFTFFYKCNSFFDNTREHKEKIEVEKFQMI